MPELVVGIDLGTSNSVISVVLEGEPIVIPDPDGNRIHPSIVHFFEHFGPQLLAISMSGHTMTDGLLAAIIDLCPLLEVFSMDFNIFCSLKGLQALLTRAPKLKQAWFGNSVKLVQQLKTAIGRWGARVLLGGKGC